MGEFLQNFVWGWVQNHQQLLIGLGTGALLTHPGALAVAGFNLFVKIPGVGSWIARNPEQAKDWADKFDEAIDTCIDKYAKENKEPLPLAPVLPALPGTTLPPPGV